MAHETVVVNVDETGLTVRYGAVQISTDGSEVWITSDDVDQNDMTMISMVDFLQCSRAFVKECDERYGKTE